MVACIGLSPALCAAERRQVSGGAEQQGQTVGQGDRGAPGTGKGSIIPSGGNPAAENGDTVQAGDLARIHYTLTLEDGSLVFTTDPGIAGDGSRRKAKAYHEPKPFSPAEIRAGDAALPAVGEAVVGMGAGTKRAVILQPEKAYGAVDMQKREQYPVEHRMQRTIRMTAEEYVGRFRQFPVVGQEVKATPYFKARVTEVTENRATLLHLATDGESYEEPFGNVAVRVTGEEIIMKLSPKMGAEFSRNRRNGRIVSTDGMTFTVDFNHPLAGKDIVADIEVLSVVKAAVLKERELSWIEDHDRALEESRKQGRPAVLVLYADWCSWCKKLLNESAADPKITALKDRFVWAKVNSDRQKEIGSKYGQSGFPLTVVVAPDGKILGKIDGYRDAAALRAELDKAL
jgi:FKBP-type peptidyl-prolyl cis-trans isomerase 2